MIHNAEQNTAIESKVPVELFALLSFGSPRRMITLFEPLVTKIERDSSLLFHF